MIRTVWLIALAVTIAACGVRRPLIKPEDVAAHEEQKRRQLEEFERRRDEEDRDRQLMQSIQRP